MGCAALSALGFLVGAASGEGIGGGLSWFGCWAAGLGNSGVFIFGGRVFFCVFSKRILKAGGGVELMCGANFHCVKAVNKHRADASALRFSSVLEAVMWLSRSRRYLA